MSKTSLTVIAAAVLFFAPTLPASETLSTAARVVENFVESEFCGVQDARLEHVKFPALANLPEDALVSPSGSPVVVVRSFHVGSPVHDRNRITVPVRFSLVATTTGQRPKDRTFRRSSTQEKTETYQVICIEESNCKIEKPPLPHVGIEAMQAQLADEIKGIQSVASFPRFSEEQRQVLLGLQRQLAELGKFKK